MTLGIGASPLESHGFGRAFPLPFIEPAGYELPPFFSDIFNGALEDARGIGRSERKLLERSRGNNRQFTSDT
jgi:hypothetical protein